MRVGFVTPWYPDYASRYSGIFVQKQVEAVIRAGADVSVEVPTIFPAPAGPIPEHVTESMRALASRDASSIFPSENGTTWIPCPVPSRSGQHGRTKAFANGLEMKRRFLPVEADVFHAHLGIPTGGALLRVGSRPLVVTEHQSTLDRVFAEPESSELYRETIDEAARFFCVSSSLREQIVQALGEEVRDKIEILPNIVDLADVPFTEHHRLAFDRWIYVGTIAAHKGIEGLLKAFRAYRSEHDASASLTIVGDGPHTSWVRKFTSAHGLQDVVHLAGPKPHSEIGSYLAGANVLVHLSPSETFGIASLEAIGAGLPVVSLENGGADSAWGDMEEQCGLILPSDTPAEGVAEAIAALRDSPERLNPSQGRAMVEQRYSPSVIGSRLVTAYEEVLQ